MTALSILFYSRVLTEILQPLLVMGDRFHILYRYMTHCNKIIELYCDKSRTIFFSFPHNKVRWLFEKEQGHFAIV